MPEPSSLQTGQTYSLAQLDALASIPELSERIDKIAKPGPDNWLERRILQLEIRLRDLEDRLKKPLI